MPQLVAFLAFCQMLGALVGAGAAVWSEIAYVRSLRDGQIDRAERAHLLVIGRGLRFGMLLVLLSSLGLIICSYLLQSVPPPILTPSYWMFVFLTFVIIGVSWAFSRETISFARGSIIAFSAWWFLFYLTSGQLPVTSFGAAVAFFVLTTALFTVIIKGGRYVSTARQ